MFPIIVFGNYTQLYLRSNNVKVSLSASLTFSVFSVGVTVYAVIPAFLLAEECRFPLAVLFL